MDALWKFILELISGAKSIAGKFGRFLIFAALIVIIDYSFGITQTLHINYKLGQLHTISGIKKDALNDTNYIHDITELQKEILKRKHYSDRIDDFIRFNILSRYRLNDKTKNTPSSPKNATNSNLKNHSNINNTNSNIRSLFWMILSSNILLFIGGMLYLISFLFPKLIEPPINNKEKKSSISTKIASIIILIIWLSVFTFISYQVPIIDNNPNWNYLLNIIVNSLLFGLIMFLERKSNA